MSRIIVTDKEGILKYYMPKQDNFKLAIRGTVSSLMSGPTFYINGILFDYSGIQEKEKEFHLAKLEEAQKAKENIEVRIKNYDKSRNTVIVDTINYSPTET